MRSQIKGEVSVVVLDFLILPLTQNVLIFFCHVEAKVWFWIYTVEILSLESLMDIIIGYVGVCAVLTDEGLNILSPLDLFFCSVYIPR